MTNILFSKSVKPIHYCFDVLSPLIRASSSLQLEEVEHVCSEWHAVLHPVWQRQLVWLHQRGHCLCEFETCSVTRPFCLTAFLNFGSHAIPIILLKGLKWFLSVLTSPSLLPVPLLADCRSASSWPAVWWSGEATWHNICSGTIRWGLGHGLPLHISSWCHPSVWHGHVCQAAATEHFLFLHKQVGYWQKNYWRKCIN